MYRHNRMSVTTKDILEQARVKWSELADDEKALKGHLALCCVDVVTSEDRFRQKGKTVICQEAAKRLGITPNISC